MNEKRYYRPSLSRSSSHRHFCASLSRSSSLIVHRFLVRHLIVISPCIAFSHSSSRRTSLSRSSSHHLAVHGFLVRHLAVHRIFVHRLIVISVEFLPHCEERTFLDTFSSLIAAVMLEATPRSLSQAFLGNEPLFGGGERISTLAVLLSRICGVRVRPP
jgi:hypothetical protein